MSVIVECHGLRWKLMASINIHSAERQEMNVGYVLKHKDSGQFPIVVHLSNYAHDSFTIDKAKGQSANKRKKKISLKASDWNQGWHNSWLHGAFLFSCASCSKRKFINVPEGSRRERSGEIKLTVFIMWLCCHPRTFIQKVTFWGEGRKLFLVLLSSAEAIRRPEDYLIDFSELSSPIIPMAICINQW